MPALITNTGQKIPQLGLGVYKVTPDIGVDLVRLAIGNGYRRIDTAALYDNEPEIGAGVRTSGVDREELFVTTKIWNDRQGYPEVFDAVEESLNRLNIGYLDMLLIHWPAPAQGKFVETWRAFEELLDKGRVRGIGVSNFNPEHIEELIESSNVIPAINQVELHPGLQQAEVRAINQKFGILTEAWSPLARARMNDEGVIQSISSRTGKTPAQVILRWHIQLGNLVIPKSSNPDRLSENIDVFDFELTETDMASIATLENGNRIGPNPADFS
jgi:2,5-diketo-D-gluconate reductase A